MSEHYFDKSRNTGFRHLLNATRFSLKGLFQAFRRESAFRQELLLLIFLIPAAFLIGTTALEVAILICVSLMVLMVELINSAIEAAIDRFGGEQHPLSGLAKDYGSAAVMLALLIALVIWCALAWQRFW